MYEQLIWGQYYWLLFIRSHTVCYLEYRYAPSQTCALGLSNYLGSTETESRYESLCIHGVLFMIWMAWSGHFLSESCADSFALTSKFSLGKARMCLKKPFSMLDCESMTYIFLGLWLQNM